SLKYIDNPLFGFPTDIIKLNNGGCVSKEDDTLAVEAVEKFMTGPTPKNKY
ncbi:hypothetical protein RUM43_004848, partial [Polyplax serrata]